MREEAQGYGGHGVAHPGLNSARNGGPVVGAGAAVAAQEVEYKVCWHRN